MLNNSFIKEYVSLLEQFLKSRPKEKVVQSIVDAPFMQKLKAVELDLGIVVLILVDEKKRVIKRITISQNDTAKNEFGIPIKDVTKIEIPLDHQQNILAQAIRSNKVKFTNDWRYLFTPNLSAEDARMAQAGSGMDCSAVVPIKIDNKRGALIFDFYQPLKNIGKSHTLFISEYAKSVSKLKI